jgi:NADH-quinone oxidoreductase subunit E
MKGAGTSPATREFSAAAARRIDWLLTRYPNKQAALLPVLRLAEEEFGNIDGESVRLVARTLDLSPGYVWGVLTFYTHFRRPGDGKYVLQVCSTLSCALRGCREIEHHLERRLGIGPGETTRDGKFTIKKVECLGSCDTAPVVQINEDYHEGLSVDKLDAILDSLP